MRVVLVVSKYHLSLVNQTIDQRNVQICAVVTDDRTFAIERGCPREFVFGFWELRDVLEKTQPDYLIQMTFNDDLAALCKKSLRDTNIPDQRYCNIAGFFAPISLDLSTRFRDLKRNPNEYKIFSTGMSYSYYGIDPNVFDLPLLSCGFPSQDLYHDFKIAKRIVEISAPPPRTRDLLKTN